MDLGEARPPQMLPGYEVNFIGLVDGAFASGNSCRQQQRSAVVGHSVIVKDLAKFLQEKPFDL